MSTQRRPYSEIPDELFRPGISRTVIIPSGSELRCELTDAEIKITDVGRLGPKGLPYFFFEASVDEHLICDGTRVMDFSVRTFHPDAQPQRHPELHAARLWSRALEYFNADPSRPVTNVKGIWPSRPETMAKEYRCFVENTTEKGLSDEAAAYRSFLGRMALEHGFTRLHRLARRNAPVPCVVANFGRPLTAAS